MIKKKDLAPATTTKATSIKSLTKEQLLRTVESTVAAKTALQEQLDRAEFSAQANNGIIQDIINIVEKHFSDLELPRKFTFWWIVVNISTIAKFLKDIISYLKVVKKFKTGAVQG